jgi:acetyltransferase-like isoleucine patch superfamily enzyme
MGIRQKLKFYRSVNWVKTFYFNYKKFPFAVAKKLPVFFYGKVKFQDISGEIIIDAPIERAMIGFGQPYELNSVHKGIAELVLQGCLVFKGNVQFGKDYFIYVAREAYMEMGHMASMASNGKIICTKSIILGNFARIGSESQLIDTTFHTMFDIITKEYFPAKEPIVLGNFNYVANRVSIMKGTVTPDYCTIASNTLCNKDYSSLGKNILIGGIPAKLIKTNITRDWDGEREQMERWLKINC